MQKASIILNKAAKKISKATKETITEEDLIEVINKVAKMHQNKNFAYFTPNDIFSEVWVICMKQIHKYDPKRGIGKSTLNSFERWINKIVKNRLKNFYRDEYSSVNEKHRINRMNIMNCLDISNISVNREINNKGRFCEIKEPTDSLVYDEFKKFVESRLSPESLEIYEDCLSDENVSCYYKSKLQKELEDIMKEWNDINNE